MESRGPVIGIPVSSASVADPAEQFFQPTRTSSSQSKQKKNSAAGWMSKIEEKAQGIREHVSLGSNISETVKGKLSMGARILQAGGIERGFRQAFAAGEEERLLQAFQCYLSTTAGPIPGMLFISNQKLAFRSDRSLKLTSPKGVVARVPYKVVIPLRRIKGAAPSEDMSEPKKKKYIQVVTEDGFEFWFMGFVSCGRCFTSLQQAISALR